MIDVDGIRELLKKSDIYVKENSKNFVCKCIYCGDHHKKEKQGHLYVSKDDNIPVCHCWYCNGSWAIKKFLKDLTGNEHDDLVVPIQNKNYVRKNRVDKSEYVIPELDCGKFPLKKIYMERRTFGRMDIYDIPNLIFDIWNFFQINNLNISDYIQHFEESYVQDNMVGFLSKRHTLLYLRAISDSVPLKFKKIQLQKNPVYPGLDYYSIDRIKTSNRIVLSEGNFDILGCYSLDTLDLRDNCRAYCAGCTFSYEQLLKSACVDYGLYRPDVVVLSDSDKSFKNYDFFIKKLQPIMNTCNIYYNVCGKDFGNFPHKAIKLF